MTKQEYQKIYYQKNKESIAAKSKAWAKANRKKVTACVMRSRAKNMPKFRAYYNGWVKRDYHKKRRLIIDGLGGKCACCGESEYQFMSIDHINGGGGKERSKLTQRGMMKKIIADGFPRDIYQILCHNCNLAKGFYGQCPHSIAK